MLETIHRSEGLNPKPKPIWHPSPTCNGLKSVPADLAVNGRIGITATLVILYHPTTHIKHPGVTHWEAGHIL